MDTNLRTRLESFLKPLYQDLDGVSRLDDVQRVERIARAIYDSDDRHYALLLLFHGLGTWLDKVGNVSRTVLAVGELEEAELRRTAASIRRLPIPVTEAERAIAAALLVDASGVRGLAHRFAAARREGQSVLDVVHAALADSSIPEWVPETARPMLEERLERRREFCRAILDEMGNDDEEKRRILLQPVR
ncbi:MAG: hypothetical protein ACXW29_08015 [Thermoanaerobaculia bacterium]